MGYPNWSQNPFFLVMLFVLLSAFDKTSLPFHTPNTSADSYLQALPVHNGCSCIGIPCGKDNWETGSYSFPS